MYLLASDLLDEDGVNAIVVVHFCDAWKTVLGRRVVPLPTQDCSCHRVCVVRDPERPDDASVVVTEMASSKLLQVKVKNLFVTTRVRQVEHPPLNGHAHVTLEDLHEAAGHKS